MAEKLFRDAQDVDSLRQPAPGARAPGKSTMTQHMRRGGPSQVVLRVESAEAARELAGMLGPRDANGVADGAAEHVDRAAGSSGSPLPGDLRDRFESSLGADLSGVRLHTGAESATAASAVGAKAYTTGQDIHFGAGHYDPTSQSGQFLIAHEVAHTVQQQGAAPTRQNKLEVSSPQDAAEAEADRAAASMVAGMPTRVSSAAGGVALHRDEDPYAKAEAEQENQTHNVSFTLDYSELPASGTVKKIPTRDPDKSALYMTVRMSPNGGDKMPELSGVNAAKSGRVNIGSVPHPGGKAGTLSATGKYGGKPGKSVTVNISEEKTLDAKEKAAATKEAASVKKQIEAAIDPLLTGDLDKGDANLNAKLQAEAEKIAAQANTKVQVTASVKENAPLAKNYAYPSTPYPAIDADCYFNIVAKVPISEKLEGQASGGKEVAEGEGEKKAGSVSAGGAAETTLTEEESSKLLTEVTSAVKTATKNALTEASRKMKSKEKTWTVHGKGSIGGSLGGKLGLKADLGKLLKSGPLWAKALSIIAPEGSGEVTATVNGGFEAGASAGGKDTETVSDEHIKQLESSLATEFSTKTSSESVKKSISSSKLTFTWSATTSNEESKDKKVVKRDSWVIKTVAYQVGDPVLEVTKQ
jgi:hypothetical protein